MKIRKSMCCWSVRGLAAIITACGAATAANAGPGNTITLFGVTYEVERFDYNFSNTNFLIETAGVYLPVIDPLFPPAPIPPIEAEGFAYIGNDRVLICSRDMQNFFNTPRSIILEAEIQYAVPGDNTSPIVGFQTVRTVVSVNDSGQLLPPADQFATWRLRPNGVTINPGSVGFGAGGNLVASTSRHRLYAFDFSGTDMVNNAYLGIPLPRTAGQDCIANPEACTIRLDNLAVLPTTDLENVVFVPSQTTNPNDARFYTVSQDFPFRVIAYTTLGFPDFMFLVGNQPGSIAEPKGITYFENSPANPFGQPVIMVAMDDVEPGIEVYDLDGNFIARETLFSPTPGIPGSGGPGAAVCVDAEILNGFGVNSFTWDLAGATNAGDPTLPGTPGVLACPRAENDIFFRWTSPVDGLVTLAGDIDVVNSDPNFELLLTVFDGTACPPAGPLAIACRTTSVSDARIDAAWIATAGNEYLIRFASVKAACPDDLGGAGACCLPDETCVEVTKALCESLSGTYFGDDTSCGSINCATAVPCDPTPPYGRGVFGISANRPLPQFDVSECLRQLQFESMAVQPETGRIFLNQQGRLFECNSLYVLTPVNAATPCPCDYNNNGLQEIGDYFTFLTAFFAQLGGPGSADFDGDGTVTIGDYFAFLGCLPAIAASTACP